MKEVGKNNELINNYKISRIIYKWLKRIFYHLIDISIVISFIILKKIMFKLLRRGFVKKVQEELLKNIIYQYLIQNRIKMKKIIVVNSISN